MIPVSQSQLSSYNKKTILRQSHQQQPGIGVVPQSQIFPSQDLNNSNKGSKISINSLQKSKDRIQQIKQ